MNDQPESDVRLGLKIEFFENSMCVCACVCVCVYARVYGRDPRECTEHASGPPEQESGGGMSAVVLGWRCGQRAHEDSEIVVRQLVIDKPG